jgi:hypothetical protein
MDTDTTHRSAAPGASATAPLPTSPTALARATGIGVVLAGTVGLQVLALAAVAGDGLVVRQGGGDPAALTVPAVLVTILVVGTGAWAVAVGASARMRRPRRTVALVGALVFLGFLAPPAASAQGVGTLVGLYVLHLAVAVAVLVPVLRAVPQLGREAHPRAV